MIKLYIGVLLCLCWLSSCKTREFVERVETKDTHRVDSVSLVLEKTIKPTSIAAVMAHIDLEIDSLLKLPAGALFQKKNDRVTAKVERTHNGGFLFTASCDSLVVYATELKTEIYRLNKDNTVLESRLSEQKIITIKEPSSLQWFQIWGFRFISIAVISTFINKKFNIWTKILKILTR